MAVTRATGMPLGKHESTPEVTNSSPTRTGAFCRTNRSSSGSPGPPPDSMPCTRPSDVSTATREPVSVRSSATEVLGPALSTRPTTPSQDVTGVPGAAPLM